MMIPQHLVPDFLRAQEKEASLSTNLSMDTAEGDWNLAGITAFPCMGKIKHSREISLE